MEDDNTAEIWKKVEGHEYFISTRGRVKNKRNNIMKPNLNDGYYQIGLYTNKKRKYFLVSRLVAIAFIPNPHNLPQADHINKNRTDNNVGNLRWLSAMENTQSVNKTVNIGCVCKDHYTFQAKLIINGIPYTFSNVNEDKCWDWLYARRIELEYNLNLTELDIRQCRKKGTGTIATTPNGRFIARITKNNKRYSKTFDTNENAEKWLENFSVTL
jgi:hypothetical protein